MSDIEFAFRDSDRSDYWGVSNSTFARYRLRLNENFFVEQPTRPNAWFRFWQRVLLGWTWEGT